jgi:MFS family permease
MTVTFEHATPSVTTEPASEGLRSRRWAVLAVVCLAVFVTVLDGTIVNVALPSLALELDASTRQLQWIVDAYLLVFTGFLLAAGGLGDRYGRKRALITGLVVFGAMSAFAGLASDANTLVAGRALMGIGAALIFPATLAFSRTRSRTRASARGRSGSGVRRAGSQSRPGRSSGVGCSSTSGGARCSS